MYNIPIYYLLVFIAIDCGRPSVSMNVNVTYDSTSFNARLTLTCAEGLLPFGVSSAQCFSNGSWAPDPTEFTCKSMSLTLYIIIYYINAPHNANIHIHIIYTQLTVEYLLLWPHVHVAVVLSLCQTTVPHWKAQHCNSLA